MSTTRHLCVYLWGGTRIVCYIWANSEKDRRIQYHRACTLECFSFSATGPVSQHTRWPLQLQGRRTKDKVSPGTAAITARIPVEIFRCSREFQLYASWSYGMLGLGTLQILWSASWNIPLSGCPRRETSRKAAPVGFILVNAWEPFLPHWFDLAFWICSCTRRWNCNS